MMEKPEMGGAKLSDLLEQLEMEMPDNPLVNKIMGAYESEIGDTPGSDVSLDDELDLFSTEAESAGAPAFDDLFSEDMDDDMPLKKNKKKKKSPLDEDIALDPVPTSSGY